MINGKGVHLQTALPQSVTFMHDPEDSLSTAMQRARLFMF